MRFRYSFEKNANLFANNVDHDQMQCSLASDLGLDLPVTLFWVSRLQWVKRTFAFSFICLSDLQLSWEVFPVFY